MKYKRKLTLHTEPLVLTRAHFLQLQRPRQTGQWIFISFLDIAEYLVYKQLAQNFTKPEFTRTTQMGVSRI